MGRTIDESLLSTASTLVDSCSSDPLLFLEENDKDYHRRFRPKRNDGKPSTIHWKKQEGPRKTTTLASGTLRSQMAIPEQSAVASGSSLPHELSIGHTPVASNAKLDRLRERTRVLRKQGSQRIAETRASLRNSRSVASLASDATSLQNESYASSRKRVHPSRRKSLTIDTQEHSDLPAFLLRSNKVIDRLSTEIAAAGDLINNSTHLNETLNQTNVCLPSNSVSLDDDQVATANDGNSFHNISVGDEWDESTISAIPPGSLASYPPGIVTLRQELPPPSQSVNCSGLPPPEVVVKPRKRRSPQKDPMIHPTLSNPEERHFREHPPSMSPQKGDCVSMYNTNQKCEKLSMENDYLKRQLEILEHRHRDWEQKIVDQIHTELFPGAVRSPGTTAASSPTSKASFRHHSRRKRKGGHRKRFATLLVVAPILLTTTLWLYQALRNASEARRKAAMSGSDYSPPLFFDSASSDTNGDAKEKNFSRASLVSMAMLLRQGILRQTVFHPIFAYDQWNKIDERPPQNNDFSSGEFIPDEKETEEEDVEFPHDIIDLPSIHEAPRYQQGEDGKGNPFQRWIHRRLSKIKLKIREETNPAGVWLKKQRQILTKKRHSEL